MTTKIKIIVGFVFMIVLLAGVATLGYVDVQGSSNAFVEYRRMARFNVGTSDMSATLYRTAAVTYRFMLTATPAAGEEAEKWAQNFITLAKANKDETSSPEEDASLEALIKSMQDYITSQTNLRKSLLAIKEQYANVMAPNGLELYRMLEKFAITGRDLNVIPSLYAAAHASNEYALFLSALGRFSESLSEEHAKAAATRLTTVNKAIDDLEKQISTPQGRTDFAGVKKAQQNIIQSFNEMRSLALSTETSFANLTKIQGGIISAIEKLTVESDTQMRDFGTLTLESNEAAQRSMLIVGVVGMIIGVAFAIFIIIGLIRVLERVSSFASAIAKGNFAYDPQIKEKGEIGVMVASLQQIPDLLKNIVSRCGELANSVSSGHFRDEFDVNRFEGDFKNLVSAVNAINGAFGRILDSLPMSLMAGNLERKVTYLNAAAQQIAGGNNTGGFCGDLLGATQCKNAESCMGNKCISSKSTSVDEVTVDTPEGTKFFNAITAPLYDLNKNIAGFMEITSDITDIRDAQNLMVSVATQASEISDRVAAASEELAAQVEQVSRGAEMQRERVEATASAMTEMNSTVLEVARNAGQAAEQSDGTRQNAESGAELVNKVVNAINTVNTIAIRLQDNMQELGQQAENIGGVMNVISDIADQTNLLALNAAIEAARAGEAGRGFAVVADSVRQLAEKTMTATQEVGSSIKAVQTSAHSNMTEVSAAVESVTEATELANSSGEALAGIVDLAAATSAVVSSIATAAEEQSATSDEITRAIDDINQIVAETAEGMVQSSAAVQDLSRMAQELYSVLGQLKKN
ncbi:methyl-accepting chemotaxis protein [Desulfovibrio sp. OttesenSCG-928-F07]|nr:methyl-accepting chemotaxis protein [Desulfovibrio sp. OttesenSCG-928-F07]